MCLSFVNLIGGDAKDAMQDPLICERYWSWVKSLYIASSMMYAKGMKVLIPNNVMVWPQIGNFDQVQEVQYYISRKT
jgi:hypothetical protein